MDPHTLFAQVAQHSPPFASVLQEHLAVNEELLPHVLMSDLVRFVGAYFERDGSPAPATLQELQAVLALLDEALSGGNAEATNAIGISFIEYLETEPFFTKLEPYLGPALRHELTALQEHSRQGRPSPP